MQYGPGPAQPRSGAPAAPRPATVIHHETVEPAEARHRFRDAAALWSVGHVLAAELVDAACDLLVTGHDGRALAMLAGVHRSHADDEVAGLLEAALDEIGLDFHEPGSASGADAAVKVLAHRVLTGAMEPSALTVWAHRYFGHGTLGPAERLVELDDAYDCLDYTDTTEQELDAQVMAEARRIVASAAPGRAGSP
jgi:hypothetical protein